MTFLRTQDSAPRHEDDFYPTLDWEITAGLIPYIRHWPAEAWEPFCGDGMMSEVLRLAGCRVVSTDLVQRGYGVGGMDFMKQMFPLCDTIISNPPFKHFNEIIDHAHALGIKRMALLGKTSLWNAAYRSDRFYRWRPSHVLSLTWRPDFTGQKNPKMDCNWYIWEPESHRTDFDLILKPTTRQLWKPANVSPETIHQLDPRYTRRQTD